MDPKEIENAYIGKEMRGELKILNKELEKLGKDAVKKDPRVHRTWTKAAYASCISQARLQLLGHDGDFAEKRRTELWEEHDMRVMAKEREYNGKIDNELGNKFFCFKGVKKYDELKSNPDVCFTFSRSIPSVINVSNEKNNQQTTSIVFGDSDDDENNNVMRKEGRESLGATDLFPNMGDLF